MKFFTIEHEQKKDLSIHNTTLGMFRFTKTEIVKTVIFSETETVELLICCELKFVGKIHQDFD
uniref:Uncharacterized protein n=1 Tax=Romanomermis culicivorax TaxID=13658 RepID=A0A915L1F6_ROMCU